MSTGSLQHKAGKDRGGSEILKLARTRTIEKNIETTTITEGAWTKDSRYRKPDT